MTTLDVLERWRHEGHITPDQYDAIAALVSRRRISLFVDLNVLLYLGVLAFAGGLGSTIYTYAARWGDVAVLLPATALFAACVWYCSTHAAPFTRERAAALGIAFDYVLYLGCLVFAVELGYIEYRFQLLKEQWDVYLLLSSALYLGLAYRFDNRFVLSLGIATLGGWFGVRAARFTITVDSAIRLSALAYGIVVVWIGAALHWLRVKAHFLETYLHVGVNVTLAALASGPVEPDRVSLWFVGVMVGVAVAIAGGIRHRRFAFVVYGTLWGYLAVSRELLRGIHGDTATLSYFVVSATVIVAGLVVLSRRFARQE